MKDRTFVWTFSGGSRDRILVFDMLVIEPLMVLVLMLVTGTGCLCCYVSV